MRFPHPRHRLWTWMHPSGSTHQLDHILINNKWKNSLRNCRAYNSVELDADHSIVSIRLVCSLRTSRAKPCKRPKFNWKKLQDAATKEQFQLELSNRFDVPKCNNMSTPITERYESFENAVEEVAEKVVGRCSPCGMPSWVSDRTKQLRTERDVSKRKYLLSKSKQSKDRNPKVKVKMRDGAPPKSDKDLLVEWQAYFSSLLNNDNGQAPSDLPQPAAQDLPIHDHPPTLEETLEAIRQMKTNKAAGLDCTITAEALQGGGDAMADVIHCFCAEVYSNLTPPDQWITSVIVPLPKKGDLSLMTNSRGISLLSIAAKVYNKILLNRIRDEVDPILRKNQGGFRPGRSCAQQIHILRRVLEGFRDYQLPLVVTFIDFKKAFDSINRKVMFAVLRHYGIPDAVVNAISVLYKNSKSAVMVDGGLSDPFDVTTGVLQGDVLAPFLFVVLVGYLLKKATSQLDSGVVTHPRRSRRHPAKSLNDLDFADDIALLESSISRAQAQLTKTAEAAADLGLVFGAWWQVQGQLTKTAEAAADLGLSLHQRQSIWLWIATLSQPFKSMEIQSTMYQILDTLVPWWHLAQVTSKGESHLLGVHSGSWNNFGRVHTYPLQQKLSCLILLVSLYYSMAVNRGWSPKIWKTKSTPLLPHATESCWI